MNEATNKTNKANKTNKTNKKGVDSIPMRPLQPHLFRRRHRVVVPREARHAELSEFRLKLTIRRDFRRIVNLFHLITATALLNNAVTLPNVHVVRPATPTNSNSIHAYIPFPCQSRFLQRNIKHTSCRQQLIFFLKKDTRSMTCRLSKNRKNKNKKTKNPKS